MKTLVCQEPNKIEYIERVKPLIEPNEVLLKINSVGICGTDIHAFAGKQAFFSYPRVLGHEISGTAEEIGNQVTEVQSGKRYSVIPAISCGACPACEDDKPNCCESISLYGVHQDGGFTEYLAVLESNLIELPDNVSDSQGALVECFAISAHAVRRAQVKQGDNALVVGAGPIGLAAAAIAKAEGCNVIVVDVATERLEWAAEKLGVPTLNATSEDYVEDVRKAFGKGADLIFDATGFDKSMSNAVNLIRNGGKLVFVGFTKGELSFHNPTFHMKETTLLSSRNATRQDFERVIQLMSEGKISESIMKNREYDFHTFGLSYSEDVCQNRELVKGVVTF
ncbi:zinc-binding alcohol dehydrogenase family protein [Vibrio breoganii]|uniref:Zinc-binding alcohol dehydrogenase family protein n=1 Tax=Vibrio breoganii TaxID=553239 RepID=A0ABX1U7Z7_9VIBR|nr:zinc-binding alcohol dehydrogenase family protein [Vibrio breoganii]NMO73094.1 zinc-binding alcohol dehydrogenase family protein [Vibrio breoganii]NMR69381.1 zinc-binding alcohol dehydrogenase family protein [Vibrio breoganii]PML92109.1 galactonate oxidoreductase [Vibrio breoganii]